MKVEINEELVAQHIAKQTMNEVRNNYFLRDKVSNIWYNKEVAIAMGNAIHDIIYEHKDEIINEAIRKASDKVAKNVTLSAILKSLE